MPSYHSSKPNLSSLALSLLPIPLSISKHSKPHVFPLTNNPVICQICNKRGHATNRCFKLFPHLRTQHPSANHVDVSFPIQNTWIVDSGMFHHVTPHMVNLSLHQPYESPNDIHIGDGFGLKITHNGLVSFSPSFNLSNVLCPFN